MASCAGVRRRTPTRRRRHFRPRGDSGRRSSCFPPVPAVRALHHLGPTPVGLLGLLTCSGASPNFLQDGARRAGRRSWAPLAHEFRSPGVGHHRSGLLSDQAVIAGTRVPVSMVLDCLAAGISPKEVVAEYPTLTSEGVQAAAAYGGVAGP
ncbi:Protein of unknown function [Blastococcus aurantiacus]|uniref:DUF433 domain-containing protein n=1 Tax=Blastococcus aurantiacus TaxID=1550231 RepID=A0A1G7J465_9ACTN|nr:DUF433 domain-containing protein [Blastococcus aurantiacus]SDF19787.1 Protein of unknown function [Blastococcus aurantiacus]